MLNQRDRVRLDHMLDHNGLDLRACGQCDILLWSLVSTGAKAYDAPGCDANSADSIRVRWHLRVESTPTNRPEQMSGLLNPSVQTTWGRVPGHFALG